MMKLEERGFNFFFLRVVNTRRQPYRPTNSQSVSVYAYLGQHLTICMYILYYKERTIQRSHRN
eukprot:scaffold1305_cov112-Cylindrotheca_fusiformis.AAC.5